MNTVQIKALESTWLVVDLESTLRIVYECYLKSTTSRVESKALVFTVFMNKCLASTLESTLRRFIDYFINKSTRLQ